MAAPSLVLHRLACGGYRLHLITLRSLQERLAVAGRPPKQHSAHAPLRTRNARRGRLEPRAEALLELRHLGELRIAGGAHGQPRAGGAPKGRPRAHRPAGGGVAERSEHRTGVTSSGRAAPGLTATPSGKWWWQPCLELKGTTGSPLSGRVASQRRVARARGAAIELQQQDGCCCLLRSFAQLRRQLRSNHQFSRFYY